MLYCFIGLIGFGVVVAVVTPRTPKPEPRRTPAGVKLNGPCSTNTEQWADGLRALANQRQYPGRLTNVICDQTGSVFSAIVDYQHPVFGNRLITWSPIDGVEALTRAHLEGRK